MGFQEWGLMAFLGALSAAFFLGVARAYQIAPPQIIATFDYGYLVSAALWGFVFFSEEPDLMTVLGMILITLAGLLVAVAGILLAGRTGAVDLQLASSFLLPSVAAAVIGGTSIFGGTGSYVGTILGALILSVLNSLLTFLNAGQAVQQIVYGTIVLVLAWGYAQLTGVHR